MGVYWSICSHNGSLLKLGCVNMGVHYVILFFCILLEKSIVWKEMIEECKFKMKVHSWKTCKTLYCIMIHLQWLKKIHGNDKHQIQEKREGNGMGRDMQRTSTGFVIFFFFKKSEANKAKCADLTKLDCISCQLHNFFSEFFSECLTHVFLKSIFSYLQNSNMLSNIFYTKCLHVCDLQSKNMTKVNSTNDCY